MEWSNEMIMEFLDAYEGEPCIWNPQNPDHKDRSKVYDAWKRIKKSISVECSLKELKKKRENLMATYRKLTMKIKNRTKAGNRTYKPEWFAYEKMAAFLHNIYTPRKTKTYDVRPENEEDVPPPSGHATPDPVESSDTNAVCYNEESEPRTSKKRKVENTENFEERMDEAYTLLKQVVNKPKTAKDEISLFCDLLCLKLRALDDDTREIAMHEINMLMFNLKKRKAQKPDWPYTDCPTCLQPVYVANSVRYGRGVNPVEPSVDGSENSFSSCSSYGLTGHTRKVVEHKQTISERKENDVFMKVEPGKHEIIEVKMEEDGEHS